MSEEILFARPGERPQKLFGLEGFNIRRLIPVPDHPDDLYSASEGQNPYTGETMEVFDIENDPVNYRFRKQDGKYVSMSVDASRVYGPGAPPQEWDDFFVFTADVFPFHPMPGWEENYTD